jgi:hypothetical protein
LQSKPAEIFGDRVTKSCPTPIAIQIFDSENELSTALFGAFLRAPECDRMADMKITCRRWSDSAATGNFRFQIADFRLACALRRLGGRASLCNLPSEIINEKTASPTLGY